MTYIDLHSIISEINLRAKAHPIGMLQEIRKDLKSLKRLTTRKIFTSLTTFDKWAFHHGGRKELQFNIGIEHLNGIDEIRYGVAFSFELSQTLPNIDPLVPKVKLFNDFIELYSDEYTDMRMWYCKKDDRSPDNIPAPIPHELITKNVFIFLGNHLPFDQLNYDLILTTLDRLLPLYKYIESYGSLQPILTVTTAPFEFRSGSTSKKPSTTASQIQKEIDIALKHNILQQTLHYQLTEKYGNENVGDEQQSGIGTNIDVVVCHESEYWFYEIKTAQSPRACIRQAIGQLLEYSFWPGTQEATRLIVVGQTALDDAGAEYLHKLRERFSLPIEYKQIGG